MDQALLVVDRAHQPKTGSWIARSAVDKGSTGFVFFFISYSCRFTFCDNCRMTAFPSCAVVDV